MQIFRKQECRISENRNADFQKIGMLVFIPFSPFSMMVFTVDTKAKVDFGFGVG